jgi:hypothetical protein
VDDDEDTRKVRSDSGAVFDVPESMLDAPPKPEGGPFRAAEPMATLEDITSIPPPPPPSTLARLARPLGVISFGALGAILAHALALVRAHWDASASAPWLCAAFGGAGGVLLGAAIVRAFFRPR